MVIIPAKMCIFKKGRYNALKTTAIYSILIFFGATAAEAIIKPYKEMGLWNIFIFSDDIKIYWSDIITINTNNTLGVITFYF